MSDKLSQHGNNNFMESFVKTDDSVEDLRSIIDHFRETAYRAVNTALVQRNWLIGYRIAEEDLRGEDRAEYGANLIKTLSTEFTKIYGKGYDRSNLYHCLNFYRNYPEIVDIVYRQSECVLLWSHYRTLFQVEDPAACDWYEKEAISQTWSVRTLS